MKTSEEIDQIATALVQIQRDMPAVGKDGRNPAFKSRYMTLDGILGTAVPVLAKHGVAVVQGSAIASLDDAFRPMAVTVSTRLIHRSGQWIAIDAIIPITKADAHGMGSAITYGRRYGIASILGIMADEDDDANAATNVQRPNGQVAPQRTMRPIGGQYDR